MKQIQAISPIDREVVRVQHEIHEQEITMRLAHHLPHKSYLMKKIYATRFTRLNPNNETLINNHYQPSNQCHHQRHTAHAYFLLQMLCFKVLVSHNTVSIQLDYRFKLFSDLTSLDQVLT